LGNHAKAQHTYYTIDPEKSNIFYKFETFASGFAIQIGLQK